MDFFNLLDLESEGGAEVAAFFEEERMSLSLEDATLAGLDFGRE